MSSRKAAAVSAFAKVQSESGRLAVSASSAGKTNRHISDVQRKTVLQFSLDGHFNI